MSSFIAIITALPTIVSLITKLISFIESEKGKAALKQIEDLEKAFDRLDRATNNEERIKAGDEISKGMHGKS